jgi:DNA-binding FadR family transcriptional regulator
MNQFKPIKHSRVYEDVLLQLKDAIFSRRFKAGDKLPSERELTAQFQVSRGVIREAIRALELGGFVAIRQGPAGGAFVTDLTFNQVGNAFLDLFLANKLSMKEVARVRLHIEPEVARMAVRNISGSGTERIREAEAEEHLAFHSYRDRVDRLTRVHTILAAMCGNHFFEAIVKSMLQVTAEVVLAVDPDHDPDHDTLHGPGEHIAIVEAVIAGDGDGAAEAMTVHLKRFADDLVAMERIYRQRFS